MLTRPGGNVDEVNHVPAHVLPAAPVSSPGSEPLSGVPAVTEKDSCEIGGPTQLVECAGFRGNDNANNADCTPSQRERQQKTKSNDASSAGIMGVKIGTSGTGMSSLRFLSPITRVCSMQDYKRNENSTTYRTCTSDSKSTATNSTAKTNSTTIISVPLSMTNTKNSTMMNGKRKWGDCSNDVQNPIFGQQRLALPPSGDNIIKSLNVKNPIQKQQQEKQIFPRREQAILAPAPLLKPRLELVLPTANITKSPNEKKTIQTKHLQKHLSPREELADLVPTPPAPALVPPAFVPASTSTSTSPTNKNDTEKVINEMDESNPEDEQTIIETRLKRRMDSISNCLTSNHKATNANQNDQKASSPVLYSDLFNVSHMRLKMMVKKFSEIPEIVCNNITEKNSNDNRLAELASDQQRQQQQQSQQSQSRQMEQFSKESKLTETNECSQLNKRIESTEIAKGPPQSNHNGDINANINANHRFPIIINNNNNNNNNNSYTSNISQMKENTQPIQQKPIEYVSAPSMREHDVLIGHRSFANYKGNKLYSQSIQKHMQQYVISNQNEKIDLSYYQYIYKDLCIDLIPAARFLRLSRNPDPTKNVFIIMSKIESLHFIRNTFVRAASVLAARLSSKKGEQNSTTSTKSCRIIGDSGNNKKFQNEDNSNNSTSSSRSYTMVGGTSNRGSNKKFQNEDNSNNSTSSSSSRLDTILVGGTSNRGTNKKFQNEDKSNNSTSSSRSYAIVGGTSNRGNNKKFQNEDKSNNSTTLSAARSTLKRPTDNVKNVAIEINNNENKNNNRSKSNSSGITPSTYGLLEKNIDMLLSTTTKSNHSNPNDNSEKTINLKSTKPLHSEELRFSPIMGRQADNRNINLDFPARPTAANISISSTKNCPNCFGTGVTYGFHLSNQPSATANKSTNNNENKIQEAERLWEIIPDKNHTVSQRKEVIRRKASRYHQILREINQSSSSTATAATATATKYVNSGHEYGQKGKEVDKMSMKSIEKIQEVEQVLGIMRSNQQTIVERVQVLESTTQSFMEKIQLYL